MEFRQHYLENARFEFQRMKGLAERAMEQIPSADGFHFELDEASNSIAVLIQHLSGNMVSRWTDFLTSDGEKPTRHRDAEFGSNPERTRDELLTIWGRGWSSLFESLGALAAEDLARRSSSAAKSTRCSKLSSDKSPMLRITSANSFTLPGMSAQKDGRA